MQNRSGIVRPQSVLGRAKVEAKDVLIERARVRGMISYSELVARITTLTLSARDARLYQLLDDISAEEHHEGRGMLSCLVVHKVGDMEPGVGFYELAARLGKKPHNKLVFWVSEMHRVHAVWATNEVSHIAEPRDPAAITRMAAGKSMSKLRPARQARPARVIAR